MINYVGKDDPYVYWTNTGKHFGFPDCCIQAFLDEDLPDVTPFDGTGYRSCRECSKLDKQVLIDQINSNRKHPDEFPNCNTFVRDYKESMYD